LFVVSLTTQKLKRLRQDLNNKYFYNGQVENINPELGVSEQTDLLPYDHKFEFDKEKLKLGMYDSRFYKSLRNIEL